MQRIAGAFSMRPIVRSWPCRICSMRRAAPCVYRPRSRSDNACWRWCWGLFWRDIPTSRCIWIRPIARVDLLAEPCDLALRIGPLDDTRLVACKLGDARLRSCASPAYLDRAGAPETPADLARHATLAMRDAALPAGSLDPRPRRPCPFVAATAGSRQRLHGPAPAGIGRAEHRLCRPSWKVMIWLPGDWCRCCRRGRAQANP